MTKEMRILGWRSEGLRCPDHEISFENGTGDTHKVSLIQMPNGTGKTTTLTLLRASLSGDAKDWRRHDVEELQKKNGSNTHGLFELRTSLNGKRVTFILHFDFEQKRVVYRTTRGEGQTRDFDPPPEFRQFLNQGFVRFYVFDGELAQQLLDKNYTDAERAVEALFQIQLLKILEEKVSNHWELKTLDATATEKRGLTRRKNKLTTLRKRLDELENQKKALSKKYNKASKELEEKESRFEQEIKKQKVLASRMAKVQTASVKLQSEVRLEALTALDLMRDPHALSVEFAIDISALKESLDKVKLPESAAREFFEELAEEAECICGREIDDAVKSVIRARAEQYLGSDDTAFLNSMKSSIDDAIGRSTEKAENELKEGLQKLGEVVNRLREKENLKDELVIEAEKADPAVKSANEEIQTLRDELKDYGDELEKFDSDEDLLPDSQTTGVKVIKERLKKAEEGWAKITRTMNLKEKRDILTRILANSHKKAKTGILKVVCQDANNRIAELMPYNDIRIDSIEQCLKLKDQGGGSAGETLSIAYAFLATLFDRAEHSLPFVVDSPAGPIDLSIRPKIGDLVPKLSQQFIAFTISSEREGFVPNLKSATESGVQFLTLFRKGATNLEGEAQNQSLCHVTADGFLVEGENFFNKFQIDAED